MEHYGFFTQIVTEVFKEMGVENKYVFYPWRRCYDSVLNSSVWAAFPYSYTEERSKEVLYSDAIAYSSTKLFYYKNDNYKFETMEDLKQYKIGGLIGYFYEEIFKNAGIQVDYVSKEIDALKKLMLGRIELFPLNELVGWHLIKTHFPDEIDNFGVLPKPLFSDALYLIVSREYPGTIDLLEKFNSALETIKMNGEYENILAAYNLSK